jgi:hypothetical protein
MTRRRRFPTVVLALVLCLGAGGCGEKNEEKQPAVEPVVCRQSPLLRCFESENPGREVIRCAMADLNNDGREDLIVMYRAGKDKNMMRVVLDMSGVCLSTNEVPAPYSNQTIRFRNIDNKPPMEFIVQGARGAKLGYAIFRVEGDRLIDLFGEGMEDCC